MNYLYPIRGSAPIINSRKPDANPSAPIKVVIGYLELIDVLKQMAFGKLITKKFATDIISSIIKMRLSLPEYICFYFSAVPLTCWTTIFEKTTKTAICSFPFPIQFTKKHCRVSFEKGFAS